MRDPRRTAYAKAAAFPMTPRGTGQRSAHFFASLPEAAARCEYFHSGAQNVS